MECKAFYHCKYLKTVQLFDGIEEIDDSCFTCCAISAITIPKTVRCVGKEAFYDCNNLHTVLFDGFSQLTEI